MNIPKKECRCAGHLPRPPVAAAGFTYIAMLIAIVIIGVSLAAVGEVWHSSVRREKEQELLFVGSQFRYAIGQYAGHAQAGSMRFPMRLEDLLQDPRTPNTRRYLRKIYNDPITGSSTWGLLKSPSGEIFGVFSLSEEEPIKKHNFSSADATFEDKTKYSEWVFMSLPSRYASRRTR
ncbi:MAG TPA: type II secretion system protein [Gallionellaceae bacterium]